MMIWLFKNKNYKEKFKIYKNKNGKPFLESGKKFISVSHCGNLTVVVTSKKPVGVDIEKIKNVDKKVYALLGIKEMNRARFFVEWTRREAYIKKNDLKLGMITSIEAKTNIRSFIIYPYVISICK